MSRDVSWTSPESSVAEVSRLHMGPSDPFLVAPSDPITSAQTQTKPTASTMSPGARRRLSSVSFSKALALVRLGYCKLLSGDLQEALCRKAFLMFWFVCFCFCLSLFSYVFGMFSFVFLARFPMFFVLSCFCVYSFFGGVFYVC